MTLSIIVGAATDVGRVRDHNEDGYLFDDGLGLVAVADGMGGHRGGEVASATALEALHTALSGSDGIREAVGVANDRVFERSTTDEGLRGMGTTLTAGVFDRRGTLTFGHVGDSRAYLLRDNELSRITTDHSLVEELMAAGELTEEEAERHPQRSMITRAIGLEPGVEVDLYPVELEAGDRVMLCSDGLTTMLHEAEIAALLDEQDDPERAAQALVTAANAAGGVDNITVLVVDVVEADPDADDPDDSADAVSGAARPKRRGLLRRRQ
jgi:serine/threonine protein phosphatase PrpC